MDSDPISSRSPSELGAVDVGECVAVLLDRLMQSIRSDTLCEKRRCKPFAVELWDLQSIHVMQVLFTCCTTLPCVLKHGALFPACFKSCH